MNDYMKDWPPPEKKDNTNKAVEIAAKVFATIFMILLSVASILAMLAAIAWLWGVIA